jgi:hypothetical protein
MREEEMAVKREAHRQAAKRHAEKKRQQNQRSCQADTIVENIEESPPAHIEEPHLDIDGSYAEVDYRKPDKMRIEGFFFRARESARGAGMDDMRGLVTTEMLNAARDAATAWETLYREMERANGRKAT